MASPSEFVPVGPADDIRARNAALFDFVAALLLAMLAFPFPVMRALLPVPVFVASILVTVVVAHVLYLSVFSLAWGRTPAMYLLDLGLSEGRLSFSRAFVWASASSLAFWPQMVGLPSGDPGLGLATRLSGVKVVATRGR